MTTPCQQEDIIREIRKDVKELLKFKNTAMGIIISLNTIVFVFGWIITNFFSK
jgi:hypothetical protein